MKRATGAKTPKTQPVRPTISLSRVIAIAPPSGAFSGWGPKVSSDSSIIKIWN